MGMFVRKGPVIPLLSGALPGSGAYSSGATTIDVSNETYLSLSLGYTRGGAGGACELVVEVSRGGSSDWDPAEEVVDASGTVTAGVLACPLASTHLTIATTAATEERRTHTVRVLGYDLARVRARETGDTAHPGTLVATGRAVAIGG